MVSHSASKSSTRAAPAGNFEIALHVVPDAILGVDLGGVIRFVNAQTEVLFGYASDVLVGQFVETLLPQAFRTAHQGLREGYFTAPNSRAMGTGLRLHGRRRDGSQFPVDVSLAHIDSPDGPMVITTVRDVTERNKAEQNRRRSDRLAAVVGFSGDAIISSTPGGVITSWNPAAERLFGYTSQEIIGKPGILLSPKDLIVETRAVMARVRAGELVENLESFRVRKDGTVFAVSVTVAPILDQDGKVIGTTAIPRDVTEQRWAFEAAQHMAAIVENSDDAIISGTLEGTITSWNPAAERMYGYCSEEIMGKSAAILSSKGKAGETRATLARIGAGQQVERVETTRVRKDGTTISVALTFSPICHPDGTVVGVSTIARDLTERQQAAQDARGLTAAQDLVHTMMGSASVGIALAEVDGSFRVVNRSMCDLLGYDEQWFLAHRLSDLLHPDDVRATLADRTRLLTGAGESIPTTLRLVRADGAFVWVRRVVVLIHDGQGAPDLLMVQAEDITAEHDAQEALAYQAFHDPLTGLHNRAWVMDILKADLLAARLVGASVGTLFVDLDKFNVVNDSLGHEAGDEVLSTVAERIVAVLGPGDRVGRFGGDSFVIVVQNVADVLELERLAGLVSASISADLQVRGHRIVPTASIGIAVSTLSTTPESMLRDTDAALFRAKTTGTGRWQLFDDAMHAQAVARLTVEDQLRDAISRSEFVVHYQPIVTLSDSRVVGHEALVRWAHPTRGLLGPGEFLDVAEDSGLITEIGTQVLAEVCALLASRLDLPPISVNISAVQLVAPDWQGTFMNTLTAHRVDPARLVVEVTETAALSLTDSAVNALVSLSEHGVGIHLDDFGTGYSSISVLRDLPVTGVKLDLRFVHDLTSGKSQANALAHGLAGLVNGMHLTGIAEGIETQMQAHILRAQGWQYGQGYYYGRPAAMPAVRVFTDGDLIA